MARALQQHLPHDVSDPSKVATVAIDLVRQGKKEVGPAKRWRIVGQKNGRVYVQAQAAEPSSGAASLGQDPS